LYILNNRASAAVLNSRWNVDLFKYIPDPIAVNPGDIKVDKNCAFQKKDGERLLLHFGGMGKRKGTLDILDAALLLNSAEKKCFHFVFAGRIENSVRSIFDEKLRTAQSRGVNISFFEGFCSYKFISHLVAICDCILMPYYNTNQSSGLLGYAIAAKKIVVLPQKGMLKKLANESGVGLLIENVNSRCIYEGFSKVSQMKVKEHLRMRYLQSHSESLFGGIIVQNLCEGEKV
jgi:glycosyltransferase involved in cell wall biosynthesis